MTATPIAMTHHNYSLGESASVIQLHVLGMYLPSFFTGRLVARFGSVKIMLVGVAMMIVYACLALFGTSWAIFTGEGQAGKCSGKKMYRPNAGAQYAGPERTSDAVQGGRMNTTHPPLFRRVMSGKGLRPAERPSPFAGADIKTGLETFSAEHSAT